MDYINKLILLNEQVFTSYHNWIKSNDLSDYDTYIFFLTGCIAYLIIRLLFRKNDKFIYNTLPQNYFSSNNTIGDDKETEAKINKITSSLKDLEKKLIERNQVEAKYEQDNVMKIKSIYNDLNILSEKIVECK